MTTENLFQRAARLRAIDARRTELQMAERMRDYAHGWIDRLMREIALLELEDTHAVDTRRSDVSSS